MPTSRPPITDMRGALERLLRDRVLPELEEPVRFECRVAINVVAQIRRELELGPEADARACERMGALLGRDGDFDALNRRLAEGIRSGEIEVSEPLLEHLRETTEDALRINNPKWLPRKRE